jgi:hypothetical protein
LASLCAEAVDAIKGGHNILIISDRGVNATQVAVPALLALSEAISGAIFVRRAFAINRDAADTMALPVVDELSSEGRLQATPELSDEEAAATAMLDNEAMLNALDASIAADAKFDAQYLSFQRGDVLVLRRLKDLNELRGDGAGRVALVARIGRAVYYELVALAEPGMVQGRQVLGVWSSGAFFPLGDLPEESAHDEDDAEG